MDILELLRGQVTGPLMERMGAVLGLDATQAQRVGQAVLPAQVEAVQQKASTEAGSRQLLDLASRLPDGGASLDTPEGLAELRQRGTALLPQLLGDRLDDTVQQVATQTGAGREGVLGMMQMIVPQVLGAVGQQAGRLGLNAGSLSGLFAGGLGGAAVAGLSGAAGRVGQGVSNAAAGLDNAAAGLGGAAAGLGGAAAAGVTGLGNTAASSAMTGGSAVPDGMATVGQGAGLGGGTLHTNPALGGKRGLGLLWLLPLLLLLLLGGCFLLTGTPAAPFTLTSPANASAVTGAFAIKGTGTAGHEVTVSENGQPVSKTTVAEDGTFSADVPAPSAGDHTYALAEAGATEALNLTVKAAEAAAQPAATETTATPAAAGAGTFAFTSPADAASLPAGAFDLKGTGKPGDVLEIFEDGVSLGKVTVGADGTWSLSVPSPAAGAHTYTVKGADGTELGSLKATVAASTASATACTKTFSLSIPDGQTVAEPFRFGGVGSGKSYTVTVLRGERKIGSKELPLDGTCGYSYTSKPGKGTITYSVAQTGSSDVAGKITLTVK